MEYCERKPLRLKNYDYSTAAYYFVTVCTQGRKSFLCSIQPSVGDGSPVPKLSAYGQIVLETLNGLNAKYPNARVVKYVIMPNHIHMIIALSPISGTGNPSPTLSAIMAWLKYTSTKQINEHHGTCGRKIFQRSFHDHIIRSEDDYLRIWQYIDTNPCTWENDCFYTEE